MVMDARARKCLENKQKYQSDKLKVQEEGQTEPELLPMLDNPYYETITLADRFVAGKILNKLENDENGALYIGKSPEAPEEPIKPSEADCKKKGEYKRKLAEYQEKLLEYKEHKKVYDEALNKHIRKSFDKGMLAGYTAQLNTLLLYKDLRDAITDIQEKLNEKAEKEYKKLSKEERINKTPKYFKIAFFDDKVYRRNPKNHGETNDLSGIFSRDENTIYLPRFTKKYDEDESYESYIRRTQKDEETYLDDFSSYIQLLPLVLAHEIRHALQAAYNVNYKEQEELKTWVLKDRMMEADADAFAARTGLVLEENLETVKYFSSAQRSNKKDIFDAFLNNRWGKDAATATQAAFKAWFGNDKRKDFYETKLTDIFAKNIDKHDFSFKEKLEINKLLELFNSEPFQVWEPSKNKKVCFLKNNNIANFLLKKENWGINKGTANTIVTIFPDRDDIKKQTEDLTAREGPESPVKNIAFMNLIKKQSR